MGSLAYKQHKISLAISQVLFFLHLCVFGLLCIGCSLTRYKFLPSNLLEMRDNFNQPKTKSLLQINSFSISSSKDYFLKDALVNLALSNEGTDYKITEVNLPNLNISPIGSQIFHPRRLSSLLHFQVINKGNLGEYLFSSVAPNIIEKSA